MSEDFKTLDFDGTVTAYLRDHPEFFAQHPDLVESLRIPHPCKPAVSLLEYQNRLLRERCQRLHDKLLEWVAIARDNDRLAERVQRLALNLLDARGGWTSCCTASRQFCATSSRPTVFCYAWRNRQPSV